MGNPVYSEGEGDYFGAREYNVLFYLYLSYNSCRCASTVVRCHRVLRLQNQLPLYNLSLLLSEGIHAQHGSNVDLLYNTDKITCHRSPVSKPSFGSMRRERSPLRGQTSCGFGR